MNSLVEIPAAAIGTRVSTTAMAGSAKLICTGKPIVEALHVWLVGQRCALLNGTRTARAIDYTLKRRDPLVRYVDDGNLPIDNNWVENQIRPWALGRSN